MGGVAFDSTFLRRLGGEYTLAGALVVCGCERLLERLDDLVTLALGRLG